MCVCVSVSMIWCVCVRRSLNAALQARVIARDVLIGAAYEVFKLDGDGDDLDDTLLRVAARAAAEGVAMDDANNDFDDESEDDFEDAYGTHGRHAHAAAAAAPVQAAVAARAGGGGVSRRAGVLAVLAGGVEDCSLTAADYVLLLARNRSGDAALTAAVKVRAARRCCCCAPVCGGPNATHTHTRTLTPPRAVAPRAAVRRARRQAGAEADTGNAARFDDGGGEVVCLGHWPVCDVACSGFAKQSFCGLCKAHR